MTLKEFFELLGENPAYLFAYFALIPLTAFIAGFMGKGEGHLSPWKFLYSTLIYLVCIPGILAVTLNVYLFLFEKQSVFTSNIYTQIIPIISMVATLLLIRNNVSLDTIPGFGKLSGLTMMIFATLALMWGLDRTNIHIIAFTRMPFYYVILVFLVILFGLRFGWSRLFSGQKQAHN